MINGNSCLWFPCKLLSSCRKCVSNINCILLRIVIVLEGVIIVVSYYTMLYYFLGSQQLYALKKNNPISCGAKAPKSNTQNVLRKWYPQIKPYIINMSPYRKVAFPNSIFHAKCGIKMDWRSTVNTVVIFDCYELLGWPREAHEE